MEASGICGASDHSDTSVWPFQHVHRAMFLLSNILRNRGPSVRSLRFFHWIYKALLGLSQHSRCMCVTCSLAACCAVPVGRIG